jgi:hypothetical protein
MFSGSGKININYGWEIVLFKRIREFSDGITFFEEKLNWDRYHGDHSPKVEAHLVLFNFTIIEFNVYYLHHRDS